MPVQANINEPDTSFTYNNCYALEHIDVDSLPRAKEQSHIKHEPLAHIPFNGPIIEKRISNINTETQRDDCDITLHLTPAAHRRAYRNRTVIIT